MTRWLEQQAHVRERRGLVRGPVARRAGERVIDLASNDYLGLARDPRLAEAAAEAARTWGAGSTASRLVAGTTELHLALETGLAETTGMEAGLVYSSGYLANIGVVTALGGPGTLILADEHCHASLVDGCRLSRSRVVTFAHRSADDVSAADVARLLAERGEPRALIAVESIYSVGGDAAPLERLLAVAEEHDAMLLVDEAHSLGVAGTGTFRGRGAVAGTRLAGSPHVIVTATLSKALGSQGGAVLGPALVREHLVNRSRSFIFDTALAPASAAAALAALGIVRDEPWRAERVRANAGLIAAGLIATGLAGLGPLSAGAGAVQSLAMPSAEAAAAAARAAADAGVRVGCFRPPSVPDGVSRLRLTAHAALTPEDIDEACSVLKAAVDRETEGTPA
nr:8-amino-7-oxononanoate synthase [Sinomonas mesophila]